MHVERLAKSQESQQSGENEHRKTKVWTGMKCMGAELRMIRRMIVSGKESAKAFGEEEEVASVLRKDVMKIHKNRKRQSR